MENGTFISSLNELGNTLEGDLKYDAITRTIYSTDASDYKERPVAVICPRGEPDIKKILIVCCKNQNWSNDQSCRYFTCRAGR